MINTTKFTSRLARLTPNSLSFSIHHIKQRNRHGLRNGGCNGSLGTSLNTSHNYTTQGVNSFTKNTSLHIPVTVSSSSYTFPSSRIVSAFLKRTIHSSSIHRKPHSTVPSHFLEVVREPSAGPLIPELSCYQSFVPHRSYTLVSGAAGIPKQSSQLITISDGKYYSVGCGEDNWFTRHDSLGVADGVSAWGRHESRGATRPDPALLSRKLMHSAYVELEKYDNAEKDSHDNVDPKQVLQTSYEQTMRQCALERVVGSTTALIAVLRNDELRIANLGDCGICIIRNQNIIFRNEEQQHSFNYPFQLGTGSSDAPRDAQAFVVKVVRGDIIIVGSDGIFDNLFDEDIVEEVKRSMNGKRNATASSIRPQVLAESLAFRAKGTSQDLECSSPFESRASREAFYYTGGKVDDISVIVAVVEERV